MAIRSRLARLFTQPLVVLGVYVVGMYAFYFTDMFDARCGPNSDVASTS